MNVPAERIIHLALDQLAKVNPHYETRVNLDIAQALLSSLLSEEPVEVADMSEPADPVEEMPPSLVLADVSSEGLAF